MCTSCKTSCNVLIHYAYRGGGRVGWIGGWTLIFGGGGVMQKRESPDFTFPEVGISEIMEPGLCTRRA